MSSTFSLSRLGKLIAKQLFENSRLYLFCILALVGLLSVIFAFWFMSAGPNYHEGGTYGIIYIGGLFLSGTVFASMGFNMLGSKDKGIYWLSIPATHLEKLICTLFFSTLVFTLIYILCFLLVKTITVSLLLEYIKTHPGNSYTTWDVLDKGSNSIFVYAMYAFFAVQALYLLGSVYFSRYSFIVTSVIAAFLIFVFVYYNYRIQDDMFKPAVWDLVSVRKFDPKIKDGYYLYSISPSVINGLKYFLQFGLAPLFWVITWYRLKEKEI